MRISLALACAVSLTAQTYTPGDFQTSNPNYKNRNPFYFEGRVDWDLLKITDPSNAWEFAQRGIHKQDDLEDIQGAIADYRQSLALNSLVKGSCQILTTATTGFGQNTNPPPCMFTVRLRLANLLRESSPAEAITLLQEVQKIDPLRLNVNAMLGDIFTTQSQFPQAITAYQAELALSPVTPVTQKLTGDAANNAHVHWALAQIYRQTGNAAGEAAQLDLYLKATQWHSDTYPLRIQLARARLAHIRSGADPTDPRNRKH